MSEYPPVSIEGVRAARAVVAPHLPVPTPLLEHPLLSEAASCRVLLKHENHLPTGAFKVRGGVNLLHHFSRERTHGGIAAATRGNHGQSLAWAARLFGVQCTIVVPLGNNPEKNAAMRALGARLVEHGRDFDEARERTEEIARAESLRYVHSANEPHLVHGVGTWALEVLESKEKLDALFVPIGLGSGVSGAITVARALRPELPVIGVQAANAPAVYRSWKEGRTVTTASADTIADGLATRVPAEMTLRIIREGVSEIVTVGEDEIESAIRLVWRTAHSMPEGAGAAGVAAVMAGRERWRGKTVAVVLTGGNLDSATIRSVFSRGAGG